LLQGAIFGTQVLYGMLNINIGRDAHQNQLCVSEKSKNGHQVPLIKLWYIIHFKHFFSILLNNAETTDVLK